MRIAGVAGIEESQLGGHRLSHDHSAGIAQPFNDPGIGVGPPPGKDRCAALSRHAGGIDDVLEAHGYAMQRPNAEACTLDPVHLRCLLKSLLRIKMSPGMDRPVGLLDPGKASLDQIDRTDQPLPDLLGSFLCCQRCGIHLHGMYTPKR